MKLVRIFVCAIFTLSIMGLITPKLAAQQLVATSTGEVRPDVGLKSDDRSVDKTSNGQSVSSSGDVSVRPSIKNDVPPSALPRVIRFSYTLNDASGVPVNGRIHVTFTLYSEANSTEALWTETHTVDVVDGKYNVLLGSTNKEGIPGELFSTDTARWLSVKVDGQPEQPRSLLVSVPYAMKAVEAERLSGKLASDFVTHEQMADAVRSSVKREVSAAAPTTRPTSVTSNTSAIFQDNTASQVLLVQQDGSSSTSSAILATTQGLVAITGSSTASNGNAIGVSGQSVSLSGRGVYGNAVNGVGTTAGVQGNANSTVGIGVLGTEVATSGTTYGVQGSAASPSGIGVAGLATASGASTFGVGVLGSSASLSGIGVQGLATSSSGIGIGVDAQSAASSGIAVRASVSNGGNIFTGISNNAVLVTIDALGRIAATDTHGNQFLSGFGANESGASGITSNPNGVGLSGTSTATGPGVGTGVYGETSSQSGAGIIGFSKASPGGNAPAVHGEAQGTSGVAAWFEAFDLTGNTTGLIAQTYSPNGVAGILNLGNSAACTPSSSSRILSLQNNCVEKASFDANGRLTINAGSITANGPSINNTVTWNSAGTAFTNILSNVTDSGSAAASKLIDLQVGGVSKFSVDKNGNMIVGGSIGGSFNAATATALAATPTQCAGSNYATGIAASGNANCAQVNFNQLAGTAALAQLPGTGAINVAAGAGINLSSATAALGGAALTITNSGVTQLAGTLNRITVSSATGNVTLNLPQDIHSAATPTFAGLTLSGKELLAASTAGFASLNIPSGVAPSVPASGDIWNTGGTLSFFNGAANKTIAFTDSALTGDGSGLINLNGGNIQPNTIPNSALVNKSITVTPGSGLSSVPSSGIVPLGGTVTLGIAAGGVTNTMLQNSAILVSYGTSGISGDAVVNLGQTLHLNNTGVVAINTTAPILTSTTTGSPTISCPTCVVNNANNVYTGGTQDFSIAGATLPFKSFPHTFPASCVANKEMIIDTNPTTPGQSLYVCNTGGTGWNLIGDGTGSGSFSVTAADTTMVVTGVAPNFQVKVGTITNANIVDNTINPAKIVGGLGGFATLSGNNAFTGINTISNGTANATVLTVNATDTTGSDTAIKGAAAASATGNSVGVFGTSAANGTFAAGVFGQGTAANTYGGLFNNTTAATAVGLAVLDNVGSAAPVFTVKGNGNVNATGTITAANFNGNVSGNITGGVSAGVNNITTTSGNISTGTGTITSGGLLTASNGLTVSAGGASITGNSTVAGTFGVSGNTATTLFTVTQSGTGNAATFAGGKVGIGTTTPAQTLDVTGTANVSGATTLGSTLGVTGLTTATGGVTSPVNIVTTGAGNINTTGTGAINSNTSLSAVTNISSSTGDLVATLGNVTASNGTVTGKTISAGTGGINTTGAITTSTSGTLNIGAGANRFATVFGNTGDFSSAVTTGASTAASTISNVTFTNKAVSNVSTIAASGPITLTQGTIAASAPVFNDTVKWDSGVAGTGAFTNLLTNVDITSGNFAAATSKLLDLQVNNASVFSIDTTGAISVGSINFSAIKTGTNAGQTLTLSTSDLVFSSTGTLKLNQTGSVAISTTTNGTLDIGASANRFNNVFGKVGDFTGVTAGTSGISTTGAITTSTNGTLNIGAGANRFNNVFGVTGDFTGVVAGTSGISTTGAITTSTVGTLNIGGGANPFNNVFANTINTGTSATASTVSNVTFTNQAVSNVSTIAASGPITLTQGTIAANAPVINDTVTWNSAGTKFTNLFTNVTDTASLATSLLLDMQVGGVSKFSIDKSGAITVGSLSFSAITSGTNAGQTLTMSTSDLVFSSTGTLKLNQTGTVGISTTTNGTLDIGASANRFNNVFGKVGDFTTVTAGGGGINTGAAITTTGGTVNIGAGATRFGTVFGTTGDFTGVVAGTSGISTTGAITTSTVGTLNIGGGANPFNNVFANTINTGTSATASTISNVTFTNQAVSNVSTIAASGPITLTQGTIAANAPVINDTVTWNSAGTKFTNLFTNVTDTASLATSLLLDMQVGGVSKFSIDKSGAITVGSLSFSAITSGTNAGQTLTMSTSDLVFSSTGTLKLNQTGTVAISTTTNGTLDIGASANRFNNVFGKVGDFTTVTAGGGGINTGAAITTTGGTVNIGAGATRFGTVFGTTGDFTGVVAGTSGISTTGAITTSTVGTLNIGGGANPFNNVFANTINTGTSATASTVSNVTFTNKAVSNVSTIAASGPITLTQGTITASAPVINDTVKWDSGVAGTGAFTNLLTNVDLSSGNFAAATSRLLDMQVGGVSKFAIDTTGAIVNGSISFSAITSGTNTGQTLTMSASDLVFSSTGTLQLNQTGSVAISTTTNGTLDIGATANRFNNVFGKTADFSTSVTTGASTAASTISNVNFTNQAISNVSTLTASSGAAATVSATNTSATGAAIFGTNNAGGTGVLGTATTVTGGFGGVFYNTFGATEKAFQTRATDGTTARLTVTGEGVTTLAASSASAALGVTQSGTGAGASITTTGAGNQRGLTVDTSAGTGTTLTLNGNSTGARPVLSLNQGTAGTGQGLSIAMNNTASTATALNITTLGTANQKGLVVDTSAGTGPAATFTAQTNDVVTMTGTATGRVLNVIGATGGTNDPVAQFGSATGTDNNSIAVRSDGSNVKLFMAGTAGTFLANTVQGDSGINASTNKSFYIGTNSVERVRVNNQGLLVSSDYLNSQMGAVMVNMPNDPSGTTVNNKLAVVNPATGQLVLAPNGATSGVVGIVVSGAGTSGQAQVAIGGVALCNFNATAVNLGDYVVADSNGQCKAAGTGANFPPNTQVIGQALASGSNGNLPVRVFGPETGTTGDGGYVTLGTTQTITGNKTFNNVNNSFTGASFTGGTGSFASGSSTNLTVTATGQFAATFMGGNVGIGLINPAFTLDVLGTINASGNVTGANISATGTVTAGTSFSGQSASLTGVAAADTLTVTANNQKAASFIGGTSATAVTITAGTGQSALALTGSTVNPALNITDGGGGSISANGLITSSGNIQTTGSGSISTTVTGNISSATSISAVNDIISSTGDLVSTAGNVTASSGTVTGNTVSAGVGGINTTGSITTSTNGTLNIGAGLNPFATLFANTINTGTSTSASTVSLVSINNQAISNVSTIAATGPLTLTQPAITATAPVINGSSTWNGTAATQFTNLQTNVTALVNTYSPATSLLLDMQFNSASVFAIDTTGTIVNGGINFSGVRTGTNALQTLTMSTSDLVFSSTGTLQLNQTGSVAISTTTNGTLDIGASANRFNNVYGSTGNFAASGTANGLNVSGTTSGTLAVVDASSATGVGLTVTGNASATAATITAGAGQAGLTFGPANGTKVLIQDNGAPNNYGIGMNAGEMQFFIPALKAISFNTGGSLQTPGTQQVMKIDTNGGTHVSINTALSSATLNVGGDVHATGLLIGDAGINDSLPSGSGILQIRTNSGPLQALLENPSAGSKAGLQVDASGSIGFLLQANAASGNDVEWSDVNTGNLMAAMNAVDIGNGHTGMHFAPAFYAVTDPFTAGHVTTGLLAQYNAGANQAVNAASGAIVGILGIVTSADITNDTATIAQSGPANCKFDAGGVAAGNYVVASALIAGRCADGGTPFPFTGQVVGRALETVAANGTGPVLVFAPENGSSGAGFVTLATPQTITGTKTFNNANLLFTGTGIVDFGTANGTKILIQDNGAPNNYGIGMNAGEMQFFIPALKAISFNVGGSLQTPGTQQVMKIDTNGGTHVSINTALSSATLNVGGDVHATGLLIGDAGINDSLPSGSGILQIRTNSGPLQALLENPSAGSKAGLQVDASGSIGFLLQANAASGNDVEWSDVNTGNLMAAMNAVDIGNSHTGMHFAPAFFDDGTTVAGKLAQYNGGSNQVTLAAGGATSGIVGIVTSLDLTTNTTTIAQSGPANCTFDGGGVAAGNYVIASATSGQCADGGATFPISGQVIGRALLTVAGNGTGPVLVFSPETGSNSTGFVTLSGAQTITGDKTFNSANILFTGTGGLQLNGSSGITTTTVSGTLDIGASGNRFATVYGTTGDFTTAVTSKQLFGATGSIAVSTPALSTTQTWAGTAVDPFTNIFSNITAPGGTYDPANSRLFDLKFNGVSVFSVDTVGAMGTDLDLGTHNITNTDSLTVVGTGGFIALPAHSTGAASRGTLRFVGAAGDPTAPVAGDLWYDTTTNTFRYFNGTTSGGFLTGSLAPNTDYVITGTGGASTIALDVSTGGANSIGIKGVSSGATIGSVGGLFFNSANNGNLGLAVADKTGASYNFTVDGSGNVVSQAIVTAASFKDGTATLTSGTFTGLTSVTTDSLTIPNTGTTATFGIQITSTVATGTAPLVIASTTPVTTLTVANHPTVQYGDNGTDIVTTSAVTSPIIHSGRVTLAANAGLVNFGTAYTTNTSYSCTLYNETTSTNLISYVRAAGSITVASTGATDVITFTCIGN